MSDDLDPTAMSEEVHRWWTRLRDGWTRYHRATEARLRSGPAETIELACQRLIGLAKTVAAPTKYDAGALDDALDVLRAVIATEDAAIARGRLVKAIRTSDRRVARASRLIAGLERGADELAKRWAAQDVAADDAAAAAAAESLSILDPGEWAAIMAAQSSVLCAGTDRALVAEINAEHRCAALDR